MWVLYWVVNEHSGQFNNLRSVWKWIKFNWQWLFYKMLNPNPNFHWIHNQLNKLIKFKCFPLLFVREWFSYFVTCWPWSLQTAGQAVSTHTPSGLFPPCNHSECDMMKTIFLHSALIGRKPPSSLPWEQPCWPFWRGGSAGSQSRRELSKPCPADVLWPISHTVKWVPGFRNKSSACLHASTCSSYSVPLITLLLTCMYIKHYCSSVQALSHIDNLTFNGSVLNGKQPQLKSLLLLRTNSTYYSFSNDVM